MSTSGLGKTPNNNTKNAIGTTVASSHEFISVNLLYDSLSGPRKTR